MAKNPFGGAGDEEVIRMTGEIITILTKDASIMEGINTLLPNLATIQSAHDRHRSVFSDVLGGNHQKEEELQAIRNEVNAQLGMLRGLAVLTGSKDPTIPQRLGLAQQQPVAKRASSHLNAPANFRVVYDGHLVVARANAVKGAKSYEIWGCEGDPMVESNWRHLITSSRVNRIVMTGLTPGSHYYFRIRAISSHNGPWSNFASIIAI